MFNRNPRPQQFPNDSRLPDIAPLCVLIPPEGGYVAPFFLTEVHHGLDSFGAKLGNLASGQV
mgnify:CR=1 FL=1